MSLRRYGVYASLIAFSLFFLAGAVVPAARAQQSTAGTVTVTVTDQSGAIVSGAQLELRDLATNGVHTGVTQDSGAYSFVGLNVGTYSLTITKQGFQKQVFDSVIVHATQVTDIKAALAVGVASQTIEVHETAAPLVETTTNSISTNIDLKEVEDLPLGGRNLAGLTSLVPGTANVPGVGPTWNGLPVMAQGSNVDGVIGNTNRMKFEGDAATPDVEPRIEDMAEMTVQTAHLDANQGNGQSAMEVNYVTRRGTNSFHGRAFEDFQNAYLNANSWTNDATGTTKPLYELNDFGGSVGGPILKNKLFFFGTYAESKQPGSSVFQNAVLTSAAQAGVFTLGNGSTVCLFTYNCPGGGAGIVDQYNAAHGTSFPTATSAGPANAVVAAEQANINSAALPLGKLGSSLDGDPNWQTFLFGAPNPTTNYFPTVRVDYDMSSTMHFNVAWNMTKTEVPEENATTFPGKPFQGQGGGGVFKYYTAALGFDWTIKPTLINQLRGGFLYHYDGYGTVGFNNIETQYPSVGWNYPGINIPYEGANGSTMSGQGYSLPTPDYYPVFNFSDSITWQKGAHSISFGGNWYREQDHYWNAPAGYANFTLGLATGDPALNMFTSSSVPGASTTDFSRIDALYAILAGRIQGVGGQFPVNLKTGQYATTCCSAYNLDELSYAAGLFLQDSWRIKPNFTVNYGLAWSFTAPQRDLTNAYHSVDVDSMYGPSGVGNLFNPGVLNGTNYPVYTANGHPYSGWYKTPQPSVGIAWSPQASEGLLSKLTGAGQTVVRAGFAIKDSIEPYQYFWDYATDQGSFYYDNFILNPGSTTGPGFFAPGSMSLQCGSTCVSPVQPSASQYLYTPFPTYQTVLPMSATTFTGFPSWGINPSIKQPYTESWNLGIQRQIGSGNAIEVRYIGNRVVHQWIGLDLNEVNIFQSGSGVPAGGSFLSQFQQAQKNLAINAANGNPGNFADLGFSGEGPMPVFDAAFAGESMSGGALADYSSQKFVNYLNEGAAGSFAATLDNENSATPYFCNLVGAAFGPCSSTTGGGQGYTGPGAGYPINYFQANPYNAGGTVNYLTQGGYSTYNGLQVDFRQKSWHGMQFDVNYTWAHNLGIATKNDWEGSLDNGYTLRDLHMSYGPTLYDIRHTINASGTYDLPFGTGKRFLNYGGVADRIVGGWTVATIFTFHTGTPFTLYGGNDTFNDYADGGAVLNGITRSQIQSAVGVYNEGGGTVGLINPTLTQQWTSGGQLVANTTAGTIAAPEYFYGPHFINDDIAVTKTIPIRENLRFSLQSEFLNAFNHPNFGNYGGYAMDTGVQDGSGFGTVFGPINALGPNGQFGRTIELRANLEF
ncbi:MAG TPA: carboxypeptidase-like regulatory domain-containing protein [Candidatus Acidoferrum sp.]|nr:carboxypeptidase-like regulatory domain-containing protein [Candidatus Acidoferrum sp.]